MFQQITCIPQVVTITNLLSSSGRPNLPNQTGYTSHQDNPVTRITQSPNRPHIDIPISPSPHLRQSHQKLPPQSVCVQYQLHGIDSNSRYRFQRSVPISHRGIPYLKTHILKTSILIKSHIFRNPPFFTIV